MHRINTLDFQFFLKKFGWDEFSRGFYYFKWLEYPLVYNNLEFKSKDCYLDIGSGKSIFPLFVLLKTGCVVHVIDDQSIIKDSIEYYKMISDRLNLDENIKKRLIIHEAKEAKEFDLPEGYFDKVSCISTLEHIPNDGDSRMIKIISRILKSGGKAVISFPFNNGDYIEEESPFGVGYFQRRYNIEKIKERIINSASNLIAEKVVYFGERYVKFGKFYLLHLQNKFVRLNWFITILLSPFLWRICYSYNGKFHDFHEENMDKKNAGVAVIVLRKK